jgi:hypothetical protein
MIYLRLPGMLFVILSIVAPVLYLKFSDLRFFLAKDYLIVALAFAGSLTAGISLLVLAQWKKIAQPIPPSSQRTEFKKPVVHTKASKHNMKPATEADFVVFSDEHKPDFNTLMEDFKNYVKLEAWGMALAKANEILHYYPDKPETAKVRANLSFLTQQIKKESPQG